MTAGRARRAWRALPAVRAVGIALLATLPGDAGAQVYQVDAGTSSLLDATGATVERRAGNSSLRVSAGRLNGAFTLGGLVTRRTGRITVSVGDQIVGFDLPSDILSGSHYVPVRGIQVERRVPGFRLSAFAGGTSPTIGAPFFRGGEWEHPLGIVFADHASSGWRVFSRNVVSRRQTSIHGIEWIRTRLSVGVAAGIGANKPYGSTSASWESRWLSGKAVLASPPAGFRRIDTDSPASAELQRENVLLESRPDPNFRMHVSRQNLVQSSRAAAALPEVTVNQAGANWNAGPVRLGGTVFRSTTADDTSIGHSLTIGQRLTRRLEVSAEYFLFDPDDERASHSGVLTARAALHTRFNLIQTVTRSTGQTGFHIGAEFMSNPLTIIATHQTMYAPLRRGNPFVQLLGVDVRVNGPRGIELRGGTYATPSGDVKYTVSGHVILSAGVGSRTAVPRFPKYHVRGVVTDVDSRPVPGAIVRLGEDVVITGEDGSFLLSMNRSRPLPVSVLVDEFMTPGSFEVVDAPARAVPLTDGDDRQLTIVVRRR